MPDNTTQPPKEQAPSTEHQLVAFLQEMEKNIEELAKRVDALEKEDQSEQPEQ